MYTSFTHSDDTDAFADTTNRNCTLPLIVRGRQFHCHEIGALAPGSRRRATNTRGSPPTRMSRESGRISTYTESNGRCPEFVIVIDALNGRPA